MKIINFTYYQLLNYNVHIGQRLRKVHQSTFSVLEGVNNNICFFNLFSTIYGLKSNLNILKTISIKGGFLLFVNVNKNAFTKLSSKVRLFSMNYMFTLEKIPGILTNFRLLYKHAMGKKIIKLPAFAFSSGYYDYHVLKEANIVKMPSIYVADSNINIEPMSSGGIYGNTLSTYTDYFYYFLLFKILKIGNKINLLGYKNQFVQKFKQFFKQALNLVDLDVRRTPHQVFRALTNFTNLKAEKKLFLMKRYFNSKKNLLILLKILASFYMWEKDFDIIRILEFNFFIIRAIHKFKYKLRGNASKKLHFFRKYRSYRNYKLEEIRYLTLIRE